MVFCVAFTVSIYAYGAEVVAMLVERLLPSLEIHSSNLNNSKNFFVHYKENKNIGKGG